MVRNYNLMDLKQSFIRFFGVNLIGMILFVVAEFSKFSEGIDIFLIILRIYVIFIIVFFIFNEARKFIFYSKANCGRLIRKIHQ